MKIQLVSLILTVLGVLVEKVIRSNGTHAGSRMGIRDTLQQ